MEIMDAPRGSPAVLSSSNPPWPTSHTSSMLKNLKAAEELLKGFLPPVTDKLMVGLDIQIK